MISSSCSTTTTVLPNCCNWRSTLMRRSVSRLWRPILGSSNIYKEPTRLLPSEVAKLMRWLSPPESELLRRFRVRYPKPTSCRNWIRLLISVKIRLAMATSCSSNCKVRKNSCKSWIGKSTNSEMERPPTLTYPASFFRRVPWQVGQVVFPR